MCFTANLCKVFEQTVLILENDAVTACELFPTMTALRSKLKDRFTDRYFGFEAVSVLESENMLPDIRRKVESNLCDGLQRAISYLEQWFDFSDDSIACVLQNLSLHVMPTFQHVYSACNALKLTGRIDMDAVYDEFSSSKDALQHVVKCDKPVGEKWQRFFTCIEDSQTSFSLFRLCSQYRDATLFPREYFLL